MNTEKSILLKESNILSLRTAYIIDIGNLVELRLQHADLASKVPKDRKWWAPKDFNWVKQDSVWLYRNKMSDVKELELRHGPTCVDQDVKPLLFAIPPTFKFIWTDSGQSVAACINGEPWAFIDESSHSGYSKGTISVEDANDRPWDQKLFEAIFGTAPA